MTNNIQFYKAVRKTDSGYKSVFIGSKMTKDTSYTRAPKYELIYTPNEWTLPHPETCGIYVFEHLLQALEFTHGLLVTEPIEIWKCEVVDPVYFPRISGIYNEGIKRFWETYKEDKTFSYYYKESPSGSYLVKQCMITEKVEND